jgi:hypothetical protein
LSAFQANLRDLGTGQDIHSFAAPLGLTYAPFGTELTQADWDIGRIAIALWNGDRWVPQNCSASEGTITCTVSHLSVFAVLIAPPADTVLDWDVPSGHMFKQPNGFGGAGALGFSVVDDDQAAFWTEFQHLGGVQALGYPITTRFVHGGYLTQAFQKQALQWRGDLHLAAPVNVFDDLNQRGSDAWLDRTRQTPPAADTTADAGLSFEQVAAQHISLLNEYPALRDFYAAQSGAVHRFGPPLAIKDYGPVVAVRQQRATLQLWKQDTPWAAAGTVVVGHGADVGRRWDCGRWRRLRPSRPQPSRAGRPLTRTPRSSEQLRALWRRLLRWQRLNLPRCRW